MLRLLASLGRRLGGRRVAGGALVCAGKGVLFFIVELTLFLEKLRWVGGLLLLLARALRYFIA